MSNRMTPWLGAIPALSVLVAVGGPPAAGARAASPPKEQVEQAAAARAVLANFDPDRSVPERRKLHVIYFTPKDKAPADRWRERIPPVMEEIREFYAKQMDGYGLGRLTFNLDYGADRQLVIHLVRGSRAIGHYAFSQTDGKNHHEIYDRIRAEAEAALAPKGIKLGEEHCIIFCNLWTVQDGKVTGVGIGGYTAYGTGWGTAWLSDNELVDLAALTDKRPLEVGAIKTTVAGEAAFRIGTVGHEGGHVFGLPHDGENAADRGRGRSLMGYGNYDYGADRRGGGPGPYLSLADALRLASHPMFSGTRKDFGRNVVGRFYDLKVEPRATSFVVRGQVYLDGSDVRCHAVVGYLRAAGDDDYAARTAVAVPDHNSKFVLDSKDLAPGKAGELRLTACLTNGEAFAWNFYYTVGPDGRPDVRAIRSPRLASLRSHNFPDRYVRHSDWVGGLAAGRTDDEQRLATFHLTPGLADPGLLSIRPWNHGGDYLRHQDGRVKLQRFDFSEAFRREATFRPQPGLADAPATSFEAVDKPGHFLRHRGGELRVERNDGTPLFAADATFRIVKPLEKKVQDAYADQIGLTGTWSDGAGGTYWVRQHFDDEFWVGQSKDGGKEWTNSFHGKVKGETLAGKWADVPRGHNTFVDEVSLEIVYRDGRAVELRRKSGAVASLKRVE